LKVSEIPRNGYKDNKALYIKQEDGDAVLKLKSEVEKSWGRSPEILVENTYSF
jgi:hypothetical protein